MVDDNLIKEAACVLGTSGLKETIDAALREVLRHDALDHFWEINDRTTDWEVAHHLDEILWNEESSTAT
jgi:Arc/MetJ family transcription regulator